MKVRSFIFALALLGASSALSPLAAQPQGTTSLTFDSFCDGLTITVSGVFVGGSHNNWDCAGSTTFLDGSISKVSRVRPAGIRPVSLVSVADNVGALAIGCPINFYLDFATNAWSVYESCGAAESLINQGTFTIVGGQTLTTAGGRFPSYLSSRPAEADSDTAVDPASPVGPYTVAFDGYCDSMLISTKGNKLGGTHDLSACTLGTFPVAGNNENQSVDLTGTSGAGAMINTLSAELFSCLETYYFTWSNSTWSVYAACSSDVPFLVNSGTFTFTQGAAPKPAPGKPFSGRR